MELGGSPYHGSGITYGVLSLRGGIAKYQRSLHGKTPIISGIINKKQAEHRAIASLYPYKFLSLSADNFTNKLIT